MVKDEYEHVTKIYTLQQSFNADTIPDILKEIPNWVVWSLVNTNKQKEDAKPTKRPIRISGTNPYNDTFDIAKWSTPDRQYTFEHCLKIQKKYPTQVSLGFIPSPQNGVVVIDYDNLFIKDQATDSNDSQTPTIKIGDPRAKHILKASQTTFVELSQSNLGAHVFVFAKLEQRLNDSAHSGVELYPGKRQSFIAMTGNVYNEAPSLISDGQQLVDMHIAEFFTAKQNQQNQQNQQKQQKQSDGYEIPDFISEGNRNNEMTRLCGYLFSKNEDKNEVTGQIYMYNTTICHPPLSNEELATIINSVYARHTQKYNVYLDNIYHIQATDTWFDFSNMTEMTANSLNLTYLKEFTGKKDQKPYISKWLPMQTSYNQVSDKTWYPVPFGSQSRTIVLDNRRMLNTWQGFQLEPAHGPVQPWLDLLTHLIPEPDYRSALLWWIAYNIQHPDKKINWQPVILGVSGAGKDALFRPIYSMFGTGYKTIGNKDIKSDYDDGLYQTKLLHISEAAGLSGNAIEFYKRITAVESSDMMVLNIKSKGKVMQRNICNVLVITNNLDAMKFDKHERRALVLRSPDVMSETLNEEYFNNWLDKNGAAYLFRYLLDYDLSEYSPNVRPYRTTHFDEMFDLTRNDLESSLDELLEQFNAILPELLLPLVHGFDKRAIKIWLTNNGWARWDGGLSTKKLQKTVEGKVCFKSRDWHVRMSSKLYKSSASDMYDEAEEVEAILIKQKKFQ